MKLELKKAAEEIKKSDNIRVVSHIDADGISSAAIIFSILTRLGKKFHMSIEKQVKPSLIDKLKKEEHDLLIFSDLGSGQIEIISELSKKTKVIILDHHIPQTNKNYENIIHVNPCIEEKNENSISGAGVSYLLAKEIDPKNKDLSYLAIIGAIGDMQDENWIMMGINKEILQEAVDSNKIKKEKGLRLFGRMSRPIHKALEYSTDPYIPGISGDESASVQFLSSIGIDLKKYGEWRTLNDLSDDEMKKLASAIICERIVGKESSPEEIFGDVYTVNLNGKSNDAREIATTLNACGRMSYASSGILYALGIDYIFDVVEGIMTGYKKMITKYMKWIKENEGNIKKTEKAYYIIAENKIHENFIGTITSICEKSMFNNGKVVFGMAFTEDGEIKVSARAPKDVVEKGLNLEKLFKTIPEEYGYGGGHAAAGGAFIKKGKEQEFINMCEKYLEGI